MAFPAIQTFYAFSPHLNGSRRIFLRYATPCAAKSLAWRPWFLVQKLHGYKQNDDYDYGNSHFFDVH
jgi:hypothetical protein